MLGKGKKKAIQGNGCSGCQYSVNVKEHSIGVEEQEIGMDLHSDDDWK